MTTVVSQGHDITLTVQFYEYPGGPFEDPAQPITLDILFDGVSVLSAAETYNPGNIQRVSLGLYRFTWTVPTNAAIGQYTAAWTGTINGNPSVGYEAFKVKTPSSSPDVTSSLDTTTFITFGAVFDPLYIDPEDIVSFFPEATYLDAAKFIWTYSNEAKQILKLTSVDEENMPWIVTEYVMAATLCSLSRLYPDARSGIDNGFGGDVNRMQLGDFQVEYNKNSGLSSIKGTSRGNASNWCEYAEALRKDMLFSRVGIKAIVKGSNYPNPMPNRGICCFESRSERRYNVDCS